MLSPGLHCCRLPPLLGDNTPVWEVILVLKHIDNVLCVCVCVCVCVCMPAFWCSQQLSLLLDTGCMRAVCSCLHSSRCE